METRRYPRRVSWRTQNMYTYGSAAYQEEEIHEHRVQQSENIEKQQKDMIIVRRRVVFLALLGVLFYFGNVALSEHYVVQSNALTQLKRQEAKYLDENEALKIDVEKLRSPDRITGIAKKELGMSTARSNIYVKKKAGQSAK